jgi:hypothetical protein
MKLFGLSELARELNTNTYRLRKIIDRLNVKTKNIGRYVILTDERLPEIKYAVEHPLKRGRKPKQRPSETQKRHDR